MKGRRNIEGDKGQLEVFPPPFGSSLLLDIWQYSKC